MPLTLGQLRSEALGWLDESSATTADQSYNNITAAIKQAHTHRLTEDNWRFMIAWGRVTTAANTQSYALHPEFLRPYVFRNTTQKQYMIETASRSLVPFDVDMYNDVDTLRFGIWGRWQVQRQPAAAGPITIVSTSTSDTGVTNAVTIFGDTSTGQVTESITPNGTTPVAGAVNFSEIFSVTKASAWIGALTVTDSGSNTLLHLDAGEYGRSYPLLQLLYLPSGGQVIDYGFYRKPREIAADDDITDIPPPFERIIIYDALMLMAAYDNRLDGGRLSLWTGLRDAMDLDMRTAFMEGQSLGAGPRLIHERSDFATRNVHINS